MAPFLIAEYRIEMANIFVIEQQFQSRNCETRVCVCMIALRQSHSPNFQSFPLISNRDPTILIFLHDRINITQRRV